MVNSVFSAFPLHQRACHCCIWKWQQTNWRNKRYFLTRCLLAERLLSRARTANPQHYAAVGTSANDKNLAVLLHLLPRFCNALSVLCESWSDEAGIRWATRLRFKSVSHNLLLQSDKLENKYSISLSLEPRCKSRTWGWSDDIQKPNGVFRCQG